MERVTRLRNGHFIGIAVLAIEAIPVTKNIDEDQAVALKKNASLFAEILNTATQETVQQDIAIELLCITVPENGQIYTAKPKLFIVIRKYDKTANNLLSWLEAIAVNCAASLQASSYIVKNEIDSLRELTNTLQGISEESIVSLEKSVRIGSIPGQAGYMCYTNPYQAEEIHNFSRVYEALSHCPGTAFSIQLIPTGFDQNEATFVRGVTYYLDMLGQPGRPPMQTNEIIDFYRRIQEALDKPQYLYNTVIVGSRESTMMVGGRLRSVLQDDGSTGLSLIDRTGHLPAYKHSFPMYPWNMIAYKTQRPEKANITPVHFRRMVHMISAAEVLTFFHFPIDDGTLLGFDVNRIRMSRETFAKGVIDQSSIQLGRLMGAGGNIIPFGAPLKGFTRHALIVGMPGTGKTTFSVNLLLQFYKRGIPFLAIEPTKAEYRAMIDAVPELQVFTPGKNNVVPFIINPFLPPDGITLETFKPSLVSAFKAAFSMPSPLDILFANAIDACYVKHGWRGYSKRGDPETKPFGLHEFVMTFREVICNSNYSAESKGNMESAGVFRLLNLVIQNGNIYDTENSVPLQDLLRKPAVIELNAIDNQEQKALIMALLLINIILFTKHNQAGDGDLKNILLIDEAHVLLGISTIAQEGAADAGASTVKALQNMIVEIRSYGTGIIIADQSPQKVTKEIVGNTDVKIIFQLVQAEDKRVIAASSNMSAADEDQLSRLNTGEAYVYFRGLSEPVRITTEDIRKKEGIRLVVTDDELQQRMHYWDDKQELLKPYSQCSLCDVCRSCDFKLRDDARFFVEQLFSKDKQQLRDKQSLYPKVVNMDSRLRTICGEYFGSRYRQLLYCVCIRYIRKAALDTTAILSNTETERVLQKAMEAVSEKN